MAARDDIESRRLMQIERRLNEIGALAKGQQQFQADRISDVMEQIDELRKELTRLSALVSQIDDVISQVKRMTERQDRMAEYMNTIRQERKNGASE